MRKTQEKIIWSARKKRLSEEEIAFLSREDFTINELQIFKKYFIANKSVPSKELLSEVKRCLDIPHSHLPLDTYEKRLTMILPPYKDKWIDSHKKNTVIRKNSKCSTLDDLYLYLFIRGWDYSFIKKIYCLAKNSANSQLAAKTAYYFLVFLKEKEKAEKRMAAYPLLEFCLKNNIYLSSCICFNILSKCKNDEMIYSEIDWSEYFKKVMPDKKESVYINNIETKDLVQKLDDSVIIDWKKNHYLLIPFVQELLEQDKYKPYKSCLCSENYATVFMENITPNFGTEKDWNDYLDFASKKNQSIIIPDLCIAAKIRISAEYINISIATYQSTEFSVTRKIRGAQGYSLKGKFFITRDGKIFRETTNNKFYPATVSNVIEAVNTNNKLLEMFFTDIFAFLTKDHYFMKDVLSDCRDRTYIPTAFNELYHYHNKAEFLHANYKLSNELKADWNKMNINTAYLMIKAYPYVEKGDSQQILLNTKDKNGKMLLAMPQRYMSAKDKALAWLEIILRNRIMETDLFECPQTNLSKKEKFEEYKIYAKDYISITAQNKEKVQLTIKSFAELKNKHDAAENTNLYKSTGPVKVPKNSRFAALRKILPEEFEWIKTRKRLISEAVMQHHCVWSYAPDITADKSAIYSYVDRSGMMDKDGISKRYTIEFKINKNGKYYVAQTQGWYNKVNTSQMKTFINKILQEYYATHR